MPESTPYRIDPPSVAHATRAGRRVGGVASVAGPQLTGKQALADAAGGSHTPESMVRVEEIRRLSQSGTSDSGARRQRPRRTGQVPDLTRGSNPSAGDDHSPTSPSTRVAYRGNSQVSTPESQPCSSENGPSATEGWLRIHAVDLIAKLRDWSLKLDQRELELLVRDENLSHRERRLRIRQAELELMRRHR